MMLFMLPDVKLSISVFTVATLVIEVDATNVGNVATQVFEAL